MEPNEMCHICSNDNLPCWPQRLLEEAFYPLASVVKCHLEVSGPRHMSFRCLQNIPAQRRRLSLYRVERCLGDVSILCFSINDKIQIAFVSTYCPKLSTFKGEDSVEMFEPYWPHFEANRSIPRHSAFTTFSIIHF